MGQFGENVELVLGEIGIGLCKFWNIARVEYLYVSISSRIAKVTRIQFFIYWVEYNLVLVWGQFGQELGVVLGECWDGIGNH